MVQQTYPIPSCLKMQLPIDFHGLYALYDSETQKLSPQLAPEMDLAVTADTEGEVMGATIAACVIKCGYTNHANITLYEEVAQVFLQGGGVSEHWKLWRVIVSREKIKLVFAHRETKEVHGIELPLNTLDNVRLTFRIIPELRHTMIAHKLYLDYVKTDWQSAMLKVAEWRYGVSDIAMSTWYLNSDCITLRDLFGTDIQPLKHLLGPIKSPAED